MQDDPDPPALRTRSWRICGRVQGVGFRWFVRQAALREGIVGDVANRRDGSVEVRARGTAEQLERLLCEIERGPSGSRVERVDELDVDPRRSFDGFGIRR